MTSRRRFIKQAALATGGLLLSNSIVANAFSPRRKKVIIIGAGFSGLMAGYVLHKRGIDFEIIEARKRIGGRVFSYPLGGFMVELGAEWVGADHKLMIDLCERFRLPLENNMFESSAIYQGQYHRSVEDITNHEWEAKLRKLLEDYRYMDDEMKKCYDHTLDKTDWWRYLVDNGCPDTDLELRDLVDSTDFGESIREVSALAAIGEYSNNIRSTHNQMDYKIRGGNIGLADAFYDKFPHKVHKGRRVVRVEQTDRVKVYCDDGYITTGDKLICTVPTFAVSKIKWDPVLPPETAMALRGLQYARINKNALLYSERFWEREDFDMITDMPGHYFYHATKNQTRGRHGGVLISYTIGDKAAVIASQHDEERKELADVSLGSGFPGTGRLLTSQADYYWGNDTYSHGAYAVYGKGQWFDLYDKLTAPHIHTVFAGEHLSDKWGGFMEGALETGKAAAESILS